MDDKDRARHTAQHRRGLVQRAAEPEREPVPDARRVGRLDDGRWFLWAAISALAQQQSLDPQGRAELIRKAADCARLPHGDARRLTTRNPRTGLTLREGEGAGMAATVFPKDLNDWLAADGVPYRWQEAQPIAAVALPSPARAHLSPPAAGDGAPFYEVAELVQASGEFWLMMDAWSIDEAAMLLCAVDPAALNQWAARNGGWATVRLPEQVDSLKILLQRAAEAGALTSPSPPAAVIEWAMSKGLSLPAPLIPAGAAVRDGRWTRPEAAPDSVSASTSPAPEPPRVRQWRRLVRLRELGGDMAQHGDGWRTTGRHGSLAELVREEQAAGRPMSDKTNVRGDLAAAMGEHRGS